MPRDATAIGAALRIQLNHVSLSRFLCEMVNREWLQSANGVSQHGRPGHEVSGVLAHSQLVGVNSVTIQ